MKIFHLETETEVTRMVLEELKYSIIHLEMENLTISETPQDNSAILKSKRKKESILSMLVLMVKIKQSH